MLSDKTTVTTDRHLWLGGSDMGRFLSNPNALAYEKAFPQEKNFSNQYTRYGDLYEPVIRRIMSKVFKTEFKEEVRYNNTLAIRANVDGISESYPVGLEIKTSKDNKTFDDCVDLYAGQMLLYSYVFDKVDWILAVGFHDGTCEQVIEADMIEYDVFTFDELCEICNIDDEDKLVDLIYDFWEKVAEFEECGEITRSSKLDDLLTEYREAKRHVEDLKTEIISIYQNDYAGYNYKSEAGSISIRNASTRKTFNSKDFERDYPQVYESYCDEVDVNESYSIRVSGGDD